jgi:muramoyltetrapeptide carboxypeptidase
MIRGWISFVLVVAAGCASAPTPERMAPPLPRAAPELAMIRPRALQPGDVIRFVAPAGPLDRERMELAKQRLEARGYVVQMSEELLSREGYLAGSDQRRAAELMAAFRDPEVAAVFPGTGGYGTMRILELLDYRVIRANPKIFIGFSDITGLHAAVSRHAGLVTFHSPNPMWGLGSEDNLTAFSDRWFWRALAPGDEAGQAYRIEIPEDLPPLGSWGSGKARGRLVGGNLALVSALEGTPFAIDTRGAILVLEDVREAPYRIDRMLRQLELAGRLDHLAGAVLGQFTRAYDREDQREQDPRYQVDGVLEQYFGGRGIPVLTNFPFGHHPENATLPIGDVVEIDADERTLTVLGGVAP